MRLVGWLVGWLEEASLGFDELGEERTSGVDLARNACDQPLTPDRRTLQDAHRSIQCSGCSQPPTVTHRATMAAAMGLSRLSQLAVITTILLLP
jgi:hypothetical protein